AVVVQIDSGDDAIRRLHDRQAIQAFHHGLASAPTRELGGRCRRTSRTAGATATLRSGRGRRAARLRGAAQTVIRLGLPARLARVLRVVLVGTHLFELFFLVLAD